VTETPTLAQLWRQAGEKKDKNKEGSALFASRRGTERHTDIEGGGARRPGTRRFGKKLTQILVDPCCDGLDGKGYILISLIRVNVYISIPAGM